MTAEYSCAFQNIPVFLLMTYDGHNESSHRNIGTIAFILHAVSCRGNDYKSLSFDSDLRKLIIVSILVFCKLS